MIPVTPQPEPANFDANVRQKGLAWLAKHDIDPNAAPPKASDLPAYWSVTHQALWNAYSGTCAYLAIFFEFVTGASSTDHFVAKSRKAGEAYEWSNYRLSCLGANRNKGAFDDVLDPFELAEHTFVINFASGAISPNADVLDESQQAAAQATIDRLRLDAPDNRRMRARHCTNYFHGDWSLSFLSRHSPFVYQEIIRQELT